MVSSHHLLVLLVATKDVLLISYFFLFSALAALAALKISETGEEEEDSKMEEERPRSCFPPPAWVLRLMAEEQKKEDCARSINPPPAWVETARDKERLKAIVWGRVKDPKREWDPGTLQGWGLFGTRRKQYYSSTPGKRVKDVPAGKRVVPAWKAGQYAVASRRGASDGPFQTQSKQQSKQF
jgi:hypothetical protein